MSINFRTGETRYFGQEAENIMFPKVEDDHSFETYLERKEAGRLSAFIPCLVEVMSQQPDMSNRPFGNDLCAKMSAELGLTCTFVTALHSDLDYGYGTDGVIIMTGKPGCNFILRLDLTTNRDKFETEGGYNKYVLLCTDDMVELIDGVNNKEIPRDDPRYLAIINLEVELIAKKFDENIRKHTGGLKNG